jgi:hypothetical protein
MYFDIKRESDCGLSRRFYRFYLDDRLQLQLDVYAELSRKTKRHHYNLDATWNRLMRRRDCSIKEKPAVDYDVITETIELAKAAITVI